MALERMSLMSYTGRRTQAVAFALSLATTASLAQTDGAVVQMPSPRQVPGCGPHYPDASRRNDESGTVVVRSLVGADGVPSQTAVERSSGHARLDKAALDATSCFRFTPGTVDGLASAMWIRLPIRFVLE